MTGEHTSSEYLTLLSNQQTSKAIPLDTDPATPGVQPMTDDELVSLLMREEADATSYYNSEIAGQQSYAMDRYHGRPYNDGSELPNRSQVVTPDIRDTVNWMMPALMRTFAPSDELITVIDDNLAEDADEEKDAANYLSHVLFRDNRGSEIIHDFAFDALVQKIGVARVYWCEPEAKPPKVLEGITAEQLSRYIADPSYEIIEGRIDGDADVDQPGDEPGEPAEHQEADSDSPQPATPLVPISEPTFSIKVIHKPRIGRAKIDVIPPEEFAFSSQARSLKDADYHRWQHEVFLTEVMREFPDKAHELDPTFGTWGGGDLFQHETDQRLTARFPEESGTIGSTSRHEDNRRKVLESIEYVRVDFDGDGIVELRRVRRIGEVILENDAVTESEFVSWSPVRVSHRMIGLSIADLLMDIQRIRTALTRRALDSLARSLTPRTYVNNSAIAADPTLLDRIMDHDVGDVIPVNGNPNDVVREQVTADVSPQAFAAIEYFDRRSEEASGVNRHAMGIQPQAITDTAKGIDNLQSAANTRIEQVARWLGSGLEDLVGKLLRTLIEHQDHARIVKINGRRMSFDPRRWSDEMAVSVHVGMAGDSRDKRLLYLNALATKQEQVLKEVGPNNPLVSVHNLRNTYALIAEAMGYRDSSRFFSEVPKDWKPAEPGKDPKQAEMEGKLQLAQAEMQQKGQIEAQRLQGQMRLQQVELQGKQQIAAQDIQIQQAVAQVKAETDRQAAQLKAETDRQIAQARIQSEAQISAARLEAEMGLARWKIEFEAAHNARMSSTTDTNLPANRPGGRLDA